MADYYWDGDTIVIDGDRFEVVKKGAEYAQQFGRLVGWIGTYAVSAITKALDTDNVKTGEEDRETAMSLISYVMSEGLTPESMVELGAVIIGSSYEFAEEHFDPGWLIEVTLKVVEIEGIRKAFVRVYERFFLARDEGPAIALAEAQSEE